MFIGIAALVLAVSAYFYKEGLPHSIVAQLISFGFLSPRDAPKTITDGSESASSVQLNGVTNGDASYKSNVPSRKVKEEILIVADNDDIDEEDGEKTPTSTVKIELSIPDVEVRPEPVKEQPKKRQSKGKSRTSLLDDDDEDLRVPMFPALNSAQRASKPSIQAPSLAVPGSMAPPPLPVPKMAMAPPSLSPPSLAMPPPPIPNRNPTGPSSAANARNSQYAGSAASLRAPQSSSLGVPQSSSLGVPASSSLGVPQQRSSLQLPPRETAPPVKPRQKVILTPGHSPLDWADHQRSLPFVPLRRITPSELALHGARKNESKTYWTVLEGKVYDVTPYLPYHPGGDKEVLRVAGKDGTKLFNLTHSWVNYDNMLRGCEVGILVSENEIPKTSAGGDEDLESMD